LVTPLRAACSQLTPLFEFAARFGLRQLPGTLDLVGFEGVCASAPQTFRAPRP